MSEHRTSAHTEEIKQAYGAIASGAQSGCGCAPSCCGGQSNSAYAEALGYSAEELAEIPEEANLGLGCGNPAALAALRPGEVVLDLGSGAGMDAFLAASRVGEEGRVIGVDMTPEMLHLARRTAVQRGLEGRVEFREGHIESLPVVDESVDVVLSNCVINLSEDRPAVFREAMRALRPGGRLAVSDICLSAALPQAVREHVGARVACIGNAALIEEYRAEVEAAGFTEVRLTKTSAAPMLEAVQLDPLLMASAEGLTAAQLDAIAQTIWSVKLEARKPA